MRGRLRRVRLSKPQGAAPAADRAGRRCGRLCPGRAGAVAVEFAHRSRRPRRAGGPQRQRQDDLGAPAWRVSCSRWAARSSQPGNCGSAISPNIRSRSWLPTRRRSSTWSACCRGRSPARSALSSAASDFRATRRMSQVRQLSGGERARLSLALITRDAPHILILDEPTNHLDVDAREALVEALTEFGGAVVVVSHDRHLLGLIADGLVLVDGGTAKEFDGSLDDYRDMVLRPGRAARTDGQRSAKRGNRKAERRLSAEARERQRPCARRYAGRGRAEPAVAAARGDRPDAVRSAMQWWAVGRRADEDARRGRAPPRRRRASLARSERGRGTRQR